MIIQLKMIFLTTDGSLLNQIYIIVQNVIFLSNLNVHDITEGNGG